VEHRLCDQPRHLLHAGDSKSFADLDSDSNCVLQ
jgi:hypothetical protein